MKTGKRWIWCGVGLLALAVACWAISWPRGPVYRGRSVSYWVDEALYKTYSDPRTAEAACQAVGVIGLDAVPYIVARTDPAAFPRARWHRFYQAFLAKLPPQIATKLPRLKGPVHFSATTQAMNSVVERVGTNAIPTLIALTNTPNSEFRRFVHAKLGQFIGANHGLCLPVYERELQDPDPTVQFDAMWTLRRAAVTDPQVGIILAKYLEKSGASLSPVLRLELLACIAGGGARTNVQNKPLDLPPLGIQQDRAWEVAFEALAKCVWAPSESGRSRVFETFQLAFDSIKADPSMDVVIRFEDSLSPFEYLYLSREQERDLLVPLLVKGLESTNDNARVVAAKLLSQLGPSAEPALPALLASLDDPVDSVCWSACIALQGRKSSITPSVASAIGRLIGRSPTVYHHLWELKSFGVALRDVAPVLLDLASRTNGSVKLDLLETVSIIDPEHRALVTELVKAARFVQKTNDPSDSSSPDSRLLQEEVENRSWAVSLLGGLGSRAAEALPTLEEVLAKDDELTTSVAAISAIARVQPEKGGELVPIVIQAMAWDETDRFRTVSKMARLLGEIGPQRSEAVVPALLRLLRHPSKEARLAAAQTLAHIAPQHKAKCLGVLEQLLKDADSQGYRLSQGHRLRLITALWHISPTDSRIIPELGVMLDPGSGPGVDLYFSLLREMGPAARELAPVLRVQLENNTGQIRRQIRAFLETLESSNDGASRRAS